MGHHILSFSPSDQTSSTTYSRFPAPGIGNDFASPSSSIMDVIRSTTVVFREINKLYSYPSCISGTRRKDTIKESEECRDTRRKAGLWRWLVSGNEEKCRCLACDWSLCLATIGSTRVLGCNIPDKALIGL
jgi:hypothetical protein